MPQQNAANAPKERNPKMLLKYFYDPKLAQASYMVGCPKSGEALIVDPNREIDQCLKLPNKKALAHHPCPEAHITPTM